MARSLSRADRYHQNTVLRDQEWDRATQAPWTLMAVSIALVAVGAYVGVYSTPGWRIIGWLAVVLTIVAYIWLGGLRRRRARQRLRELHGQVAA